MVSEATSGREGFIAFTTLQRRFVGVIHPKMDSAALPRVVGFIAFTTLKSTITILEAWFTSELLSFE